MPAVEPPTYAPSMPPREPFTPPPLSAWGTTWRVLVAVLSGLVLVAVSADSIPPDRQALLGLDLVTGVATIALIPLRRTAPLAVALVAAVLASVSTLGAGALAIIVVSLATRRRWLREVLPVGVVFVAAGYLYEVVYRPVEPMAWWVVALIGGFMYVTCVAIGFYVGGRRELLANLEQRALTAEREQAARVDQARTAERSRIAREMHDVLAHRISLVAMHSGGLVYRDDLTREETVATAEVIRDNAQLALAELREVLGVLRDGAAPTQRPDPPQPTLAALPELIDEARAAGNPVTCSLTLSSHGSAEGDLGALPESTSRSAYRILQEALTNARKHAPGLPVQLEIGGRPGDRLVLSARNPVAPVTAGDAPDPGVGLAGLSERAKLAGGELTAGAERGQFAVRAWLPWSA